MNSPTQSGAGTDVVDGEFTFFSVFKSVHLHKGVKRSQEKKKTMNMFLPQHVFGTAPGFLYQSEIV